MKKWCISLATAAGLVLGISPILYAQATVTRTATWVDNSTNEDGFRVYKMSGKLSEAVQMCAVLKDIKTCSWTEPTGATGCYFVVAYNVVGESTTSDPACLNIVSKPTGIVVQ